MNKVIKYVLGVIITTLLFSSCKKDKITLLTYKADSHTNEELFDVQFANDSIGYACGGEQWTKGIFLRTTDGGKTWSRPDSIFNACAYNMHFFSPNEGVVVGNVSDWAYTVDSGQTFAASQSDYMTINRIAFLDHNRYVKVGGGNYASGYMAYTADGGQNWSRLNVPNNMTDVAYADSNVVFASGYGVIYRSTNRGVSFEPLDVQGDFFVALSFPSSSTGYFAGNEGTILKTTDAGNSFSKVHKQNMAFSRRIHFECIKFWNENIGYAAGDDGLMMMTDNGGNSWKEVTAFTNETIRGIHLFSANSGIVVGNNGAVFLFQQ